ncbi:MAG: sigma 54-interacting transcriptional regulator [Myxococcales bacterium]|nr:sigma 54-interacting transcriptional regulator [Myxococcales bacterium]
MPGTAAGWVLLVSREVDFRAYALPERGLVTVGRDASCEVVIDHEKISRRHATLRLGDRWEVEDHGSRNRTQLRGQGLTPGVPAELAPGEPFQLGPFTAVVLARAVSTVRAALGGSHIAVEDPTLASPGPLVLSLARSPVNVLVTGETGTGKEVLAGALHRLSGRAGALVCVNCAALSPQLLESELFGHERGAFTGAATSKPGLLEAAAGGTVLLDEIGELPLELQAKLLRAIETREVLRVGAVRPVTLDLRILAATNRELLAEVEAGRFRRDLYYRLAGLTLSIPPLRERLHQVEALATRFARAAATGDGGASEGGLAAEALAQLRAHDWPGNVRELKSVVERAVLLAGGGPVRPEHLLIDRAPRGASGAPARAGRASPGPAAATGPGPSPAATAIPAVGIGGSGTGPSVGPPHAAAVPDLVAGLGLTADQAAERQRIVDALSACHGNQTRAAQLLGVSRATLVNKLSLYRVPRPRK